MWFVKTEMADCLTYWPTSYSSDDFYRSWNLCYDESTTDDEEKEVTSLLDDLAEAKRHISTDDVDSNADADCMSLWDDVFDEQWTTKDSNGGPTLAELNGGELTDLEQYEPLQIATKRKRRQSSSTDASQRCAKSLVVPVQICGMNDAASVQPTTTVAADGSTNLEIGLQHNKERTASCRKEEDVKGTLSPSKLNRKVYQKVALEAQLKTVCLANRQRLPCLVKEDLQNVCETSTSRLKHDVPFISKHSEKSDTSDSVYDFCASKKMKTNHGGILLFTFRDLLVVR